MKKSMFALSLLGIAGSVHAANNQDRCAPQPGAPCYPDDCRNCYCLGPDNMIANAPVCPVTCAGDLTLTVAGFYWRAQQDGMEYAIDDRVINPNRGQTQPASFSDIEALNRLIDAEYETPDFKWDFGFKVGLSYCSPCDGWDIGVLWTWFRGRANSHIEAEEDDNHTLLPLWSAFESARGGVLYATDIESHWKVQFNLIDIELGRKFWTSRYLSIRPHVGLRIAFIDQDFFIHHKGGSWSSLNATTPFAAAQDAFNNEVDLDNDFRGVGVRAGLDSNWNLGCGWSIYGNLAAAIVYGRFSIDHDEMNREAQDEHTKFKILETEESFHASRAMLDLALGVQWSGMFCDCKYGFTAMLGWEQHMFFHQNQLWRVVRNSPQVGAAFPNNQGENLFHQRRGSLETEGWTLTIKVDF